MLRDLFKDRKGFTLIEVVIVLAIAGLIFVIVFLAVSSAQASRRDTARRADAARFASAVSEYQANTNGNNPATYWNGSGYYTAGTESTVVTSGTIGTTAGNMLFTSGTNCAGTAATRNYKVEVVLEKGSVTYCVGS